MANFTVVAFRGTNPVWNWTWNIFMDAICGESTPGAGRGPGLPSDPPPSPRAPRTAPGAEPWAWTAPSPTSVSSGFGTPCRWPCRPGGPAGRRGQSSRPPRPAERAHLGLQPASQGGPRVVDDDEHVPLDGRAQGDDRFAVLNPEIPVGRTAVPVRQSSAVGRPREAWDPPRWLRPPQLPGFATNCPWAGEEGAPGNTSTELLSTPPWGARAIAGASTPLRLRDPRRGSSRQGPSQPPGSALVALACAHRILSYSWDVVATRSSPT